MSPKNGSSRWPAKTSPPPGRAVTPFIARAWYFGVDRGPMLSGGVVAWTMTCALPFAIFVTVYGCCVSPRKNGPVFRVNWKRYVTSAFPSPFRST